TCALDCIKGGLQGKSPFLICTFRCLIHLLCVLKLLTQALLFQVFPESMIAIHSKTKTSFYRRVYVAWLITQGINTVPRIIAATGMPRRTAQDTLAAIHELAIALENSNGTYQVRDWGAIDQQWVSDNVTQLKSVLAYP